MTSARLAQATVPAANGAALSTTIASPVAQLASPSKQANGSASSQNNGAQAGRIEEAEIPEEIRKFMQLVARYPEAYAKGASSASLDAATTAVNGSLSSNGKYSAPEWANKQAWLRQNATHAIKLLFEQGEPYIFLWQ